MIITTRNWFLTSFSLLAITTALDVTGVSPWPLVVSLFLYLTVSFAQQYGYVFAFSLSTLALLAGGACWYQVAAYLPGNLRLNTLVLEILSALLLVVFIGRKSQISLPTIRAISYFWPPCVVPSLSAITIWGVSLTGALGYSWAMHNDAVWNLVVSRFVTGDGGIVAAVHTNPSPLIPELLSFASLSGRETQTASTLFQHDMTRAAEVWLLIALMTSFIAGLIALSIRKIEPLWLRIVAGLGVSALPLAWFTLGYAFEFGFYNATLALLLMLVTWLIWQKGQNIPYARLGGLALALLVSLAAWGPLALIPACLALLSLISLIAKRIKPESLWSLWFAGVSCFAAVVYGFFVTLPDLRQQSGSLGADGGIFEITPTNAVVTVSFCFLVLVIQSLLLKNKNQLLGIIVYTGASLLAVAYLAFQRGPDVSRWGYYPVKYSWILMCSLLILASASTLAWISSKKMKWWKSVLATLIAGVVIFCVACQMPIRIAPTYLSAFPLSNIITHTGIAGEDQYASRLFSIVEDDRPTIAFKGKDLISDQFAARWLLQLESSSSEDKVRYWAYFLDTSNEEQLCAALKDWGTTVTIITSDLGLQNRLSSDCPAGSFEIITE
ncbi:MAG: hypothetical protein ACEQR4_00565 [Rhodoluna sp.]